MFDKLFGKKEGLEIQLVVTEHGSEPARRCAWLTSERHQRVDLIGRSRETPMPMPGK